MLVIYHEDNLKVFKEIADESIELIYIDPPFNTGKIQKRTNISVVRDATGDRVGFQNQRYRTVKIGSVEYSDIPRLIESQRVLKPNGSIFVHIDYREVHYVKVLLDLIYGRQSFMNEIIWAYDYGERSRKKWPAKHDNILWYAKNPKDYQFHLEECDRIPYMAPGLVGKEKAARGKLPTDTWWHTIVSPTGKEKTGYPTQKPRGIIDRIVKVHSSPGDMLLDFFAGSGTLGESAVELGRNCILIDSNPQAIRVMKRRFEGYPDVIWITKE